MFLFINACEFIRHAAEWSESGEGLWLLISAFLCAGFGYVWGLIMWKYYTAISPK